MRYANLNDLLKAEHKAREYFNALPRYVQDQINSRTQGINSLLSLQDYVDDLTRGDG